jgi:peptide/nickel transport system ATP-binding protein
LSLLEVENLVAGYMTRDGVLPVVDGVSLSIGAGETLGLVGESGCGKSTLARAIVGLADTLQGRIVLDGRSVPAVRDAAFRRRVQMVFQSPGASFSPRMSMGEILEEALRAGGARSKILSERARLIDLVELPQSVLPRRRHELSGGQLQRMAIARALAVSPDLIVADEITSALDVSVQVRVLEVLRRIQAERGVSLLFISHGLGVVRSISRRVAVMYLGRIVEAGPVARVFNHPTHPYTKTLLASEPPLCGPWAPPGLSGEPADPRAPPSGCRFHPRCPCGPQTYPSRRSCAEIEPRLRLHGLTEAACHFASTGELDR